MCGIAGFSNYNMNYRENPGPWYGILQSMNHTLHHRGPDEEDVFLSRHVGLSHTRLSILDPGQGKQPMTRQMGDHIATIVYNGELYNMPELRWQLITQGCSFTTECDTEVILLGYLTDGIDFLKKMNGIFSFAIWDHSRDCLYLARDRMGVKPLFYIRAENTLVFSSELKGLFAFPKVKPIANRDSLCEIFGLGPAKTYGKGVFQDIRELLPGHFLEFNGSGIYVTPYWKLESHPHFDDYGRTVEKTRCLVTDAIRLQMLSDVPICTFLSGGVDSSLVTSICSSELKKQGKVLSTYSFDFTDNDKNFKANAFQPSQDRPWVDKMVDYCRTSHTYLECSNPDLYQYLFRAVEARDLPCMADVEASMLYFCERVSKTHKVTLTGECADEIFGGYPWFHKEECFRADTFPWSMDFAPRTLLLRDEVLEALPLEEYAKAAYHSTISETPMSGEETPTEARRREISYLNLKWFMQTLLDRMDRTSMAVGLEARVPFADHRIVEYLWNVPWEMKCPKGVVKGLLRDAAEGLLPTEVLHRKKRPYPKTYDPTYENLLKKELTRVLADPNAPLRELVDPAKVREYLKSPSDYGRPFYGQLMAGPQLLAYLLQVNYWLEHYHVEIRF